MSVFRLRHRSDVPEAKRNSEAIYADSEGALKHLDSAGSVSDLGGGGGGSQPVGCLLLTDVVPFSGGPPFNWTGAQDNIVDGNALVALPDGIGFSTALDGSDGTITITADGWYAFTLGAFVGQDATWQGGLSFNLALGQSDFVRPLSAGGSNLAATLGPVFLPAGAFFLPSAYELAAATGTPSGAAQLACTRIA